MLTRVTIHLRSDDANILQAMSKSDMRNMKTQVLWLIREEAKRRGLEQIAETNQEVRAKVQARTNTKSLSKENTHNAETLAGRRVVGVEANHPSNISQ